MSTKTFYFKVMFLNSLPIINLVRETCSRNKTIDILANIQILKGATYS